MEQKKKEKERKNSWTQQCGDRGDRKVVGRGVVGDKWLRGKEKRKRKTEVGWSWLNVLLDFYCVCFQYFVTEPQDCVSNFPI